MPWRYWWHPNWCLARRADGPGPGLIQDIDPLFARKAVELSRFARRRPVPHMHTLLPCPRRTIKELPQGTERAHDPDIGVASPHVVGFEVSRGIHQ
jgi:hypothetical protein